MNWKSSFMWGALLMIMIQSCSSGISEETAMEIALARVEQDDFMSLDFTQRNKEVVTEGDHWHISFPYKSELYMRGGEPHVLINRRTGEVSQVFYTR